MIKRVMVLVACAFGGLAALGHAAPPARASAGTTIASGLNATRTTIPVTIDGRVASCVLDTGTSVILVSPQLARAARLVGEAGTFEEAPDGRAYADRETRIPHFGVAGYSLRNVHALISSKLAGYSALCGYDFFTHFTTLIDRDRARVTLFPGATMLARLRCLPIDLTPHVPVATVEINGTWLRGIVLDSGMAGGGALWAGVETQLRRPLNGVYSSGGWPATRDGFTCGASAFVRYGGNLPARSMPICTEALRPDGYNGIIETNLSSVRALAVDYPHKRICFDLGPGDAPLFARAVPNHAGSAWDRFNESRLNSPPM